MVQRIRKWMTFLLLDLVAPGLDERMFIGRGKHATKRGS